MTLSDVCPRPPTGSSAAPTFGRSAADFTRFVQPYQLAISVLRTKLAVLKQDFADLGRSCPIEHVSWRVKSRGRIVGKAQRLHCPLTPMQLRRTVRDIAGVRITCGVISDTYRVARLLAGQSDIRVIEVEDYIARPKPNGYRSLHMVVEVPVFLSTRVEQVPVEIQIRTTAMDVWAGFEHEIFYADRRAIPRRLVQHLNQAADAAHRLDTTMQLLHNEVATLRGQPRGDMQPDARPVTALNGHAHRNGSTPPARASIRSQAIPSTM
jgi:putative GTP pyrophosphokinase